MRQIARFILLAAALAGFTRANAGPETQGEWQLVNPLPFFPVHVHVLPTGKVMFWPGDGGVSGNDPRLWDPANQNISLLAKPGYDTFCSGHTHLPDGRLFVAGGHIVNGEGLAKASAYNPGVNDGWSAFPIMNAGRWYPTTTALGNGHVLVVSGSIDNTVGVNKLPQVFQLGSDTWRDLTSAQLGQDLYPMMLLAPNGKVFSPGPDSITRYLDTSGTGAWSVVANRAGGFRGYGSAVMYAPGKILVMGGGDPPKNTAEVIDLNDAAPAWRTVAPMHFARRQLNALLLPDGKVLVTGGTSGPGFNNSATPVYEAEMWDPISEKWTVMASASVKRLYHSATVLLPDGQVLSTGGNGFPDTEIYSPPYLFNGARPAITSAPQSISYGQSFFVETPDAAAVAKVRMIRLSSTTHAFNMGQHPAELNFSPACSGISATTPANGNLAPPGYYLLFIVNGAGVPSIGKIIQLTSSAPPPPPPPCPTLSSLQPNSAVAGGPAFTLTVNGANFVNGTSVVRWNGTSRTTAFVSPTQLTAEILATDIASAGTAQVTVANGNTVSNALPFTITNPAPSSFNLTVSKSGPGSVSSSPVGINCGPDCSQAYAGNTVVTLTAAPNKNARFVGWSGACGGTTPTCTVTMDASKSVSARFSRK